MKTLLYPVASSLLLLLAACSDQPQTVAKKAKPEPVTGQTALWKMFQVARAWAPDAEALKLTSVIVQEVPNVPGKSGEWQATFTSRSLGRARSYTFSVIDVEPTLHKGVFAGADEAWSGASASASPSAMADLKIDSDAAYQTALKNGGADYDKKVPGKVITCMLDKTSRFPGPAWRIVWGESVGTSNFSVYVDASSGSYLEKTH